MTATTRWSRAVVLLYPIIQVCCLRTVGLLYASQSTRTIGVRAGLFLDLGNCSISLSFLHCLVLGRDEQGTCRIMICICKGVEQQDWKKELNTSVDAVPFQDLKLC